MYWKLMIKLNINQKATMKESRRWIKFIILKIKYPILKLKNNNFNVKVWIIKLVSFSKIGGYSNSKEFVLFINNRLVDNDPLKKSIENAYYNCYMQIYEVIKLYSNVLVIFALLT